MTRLEAQLQQAHAGSVAPVLEHDERRRRKTREVAHPAARSLRVERASARFAKSTTGEFAIVSSGVPSVV